MYSDPDLDAAARSGALPPFWAERFRSFVARERGTPAADEEHVRLLSSFNDLFVTGALLLFMGGVAVLVSQGPGPAFGFGTLAMLAWLAGPYLILKRRMALPAFVLALAFTFGIAGMLLVGFGVPVNLEFNQSYFPQALPEAAARLLTFGAAAVAAALHWWRFKVPAAMTLALLLACIALNFVVGTALGTAALAIPPAMPFLVYGLALFAVAMWWDMSDIYRQTRRADVAFWLHLAAASLIVHSLFAMLGLSAEGMDGPSAFVTILLYLLFCAVALIVDRRAMMVAGLLYVLAAFGALTFWIGTRSTAFTLAAIFVGASLLALSVFWAHLRGLLLDRLPQKLRAQLPRSRVDLHGPRPID